MHRIGRSALVRKSIADLGSLARVFDAGAQIGIVEGQIGLSRR